MAALTSERDTKARGKLTPDNLPVEASTTIYAGALVCVNAAGYAVPGSTSTTLKAVGRAEETVDNSAGAQGAKTVELTIGKFKYANSSAGDLIAVAERYDDCYIVDDQTVAKTDGTSTRSVAGKIADIDADGSVWVDVTPFR